VTEMERNQDGIDSLLRHSMAAPIPKLPTDFDERMMRTVRRRSQPFDRYRQALITSYAFVSVAVCAVLMRGQGLGWSTVAGMSLAPLALIAVTCPLWSRAKKPVAMPN